MYFFTLSWSQIRKKTWILIFVCFIHDIKRQIPVFWYNNRAGDNRDLARIYLIMEKINLFMMYTYLICGWQEALTVIPWFQEWRQSKAILYWTSHLFFFFIAYITQKNMYGTCQNMLNLINLMKSYQIISNLITSYQI